MATLILAVLLASGAQASVVLTKHVTTNVTETHKVDVPAAKAVAVPATAKVEAPKVLVATKSAAKTLINPKLEDVASDKKFFGPPFPADYPEDKRPVPVKSILDKVKGPDQPYPALQSKADYDADYVKDENSDKGAWKAQFEYDRLRNQIAGKNRNADNAANRAGKEGKDVDDAQRNSDKAGKDAGDAKKDLDDAKAEEEAARNAKDGWDGTAKDGDGIDVEGAKDLEATKENLKKLKKAVDEAEAKLEKEKAQFAICKQKLDDAKKNLDELKAKQVEMEASLAEQTKLWVETKTVRLNLKHSQEDAAHSKKLAAVAKLDAAKANKVEFDTVLADKKAQHDSALKRVQEHKAAVEKAKSDLAKATLTLQKLRGYKPAETTAALPKSGAAMTSVLLSALLVVSML